MDIQKSYIIPKANEKSQKINLQQQNDEVLEQLIDKTQIKTQYNLQDNKTAINQSINLYEQYEISDFNTNDQQQYDLTEEIDSSEYQKQKQINDDQVDFLKNQQQYHQQKNINWNDLKIKFNIKNFVIFGSYHMLFFYFGIFAIPIMLIKHNMNLVNNMGFWIGVPVKLFFLTQVISWFSVAICNILQILNYLNEIGYDIDVKLNGIFKQQIHFINLIVILRSFIIGVRYSYLSSNKLQIMQERVMRQDEIGNDLLVVQWLKIDINSIQEQIYVSIFRNQIEEQFFQFQLFEDIDEFLSEKLLDENYFEKQKFNMKEYKSKMKQNLISLSQKKQTLKQSNVFNQQFEDFGLYKINSKLFHEFKQIYNGKLLLREIALFAGVQEIKYEPIVFIITFINVLIPYIVRYIQYSSLFYEFNMYSIIYSVFEFVIIMMIMTLNYTFVLAGLIDFRRRVFLIKACGQLIDPFKVNFSLMYQLFPTFNFFCKDSLMCWYLLRNCIIEYGEKYKRRVLINSSLFFGMCLAIILILFLVILGIIDLNYGLFIYIRVLYDTMIITCISLFMLYFGAVVNDQYKIHILQLSKIKITLQQIKIKIDTFSQKNKIFQTPYFQLFYKIIQNQENQLSNEEYVEKINDSIEIIDTIIDRLEIEKEYKPLKIFSLTASFDLLKTVCTTLFSFAVLFFQDFIDYFNENNLFPT